jgi:splicing factor 3B subunit 3
VILYTTVTGLVGVMVPFASRRTMDSFFLLEMEMRKTANLHFKRDHIAFRSYYTPVKCVIDGDLCERFGALPLPKQRSVGADSLQRSPAEVLKMLEDVRNSIV